MATTKRAPKPTLTRAETCTTDGCTAPRIRLNALKCTAHEIVYRAAAKQRAIARKAALAAATPAPTPVVATPAKVARKSPVRAMGTGPVARA